MPERPSVSGFGSMPGESLFPISPAEGTGALEPSQVQDLADVIPELLAAGPAADLRFHIRAEATGELDATERAALDLLLAKVADGMKLG